MNPMHYLLTEFKRPLSKTVVHKPTYWNMWDDYFENNTCQSVYNQRGNLEFRWLCYFRNQDDERAMKSVAEAGGTPVMSFEEYLDWGEFLCLDIAFGMFGDVDCLLTTILPSCGSIHLDLIKTIQAELLDDYDGMGASQALSFTGGILESHGDTYYTEKVDNPFVSYREKVFRGPDSIDIPTTAAHLDFDKPLRLKKKKTKAAWVYGLNQKIGACGLPCEDFDSDNYGWHVPVGRL